MVHTSDEEGAHQAYYDAEYENNDPDYDPLFQLIPAGSRPLSDAEAANLLWPQYDSENSVISEDPPINYREEYPEYYEEFDRESYRRYRLRGGEKRFRSSDTGDEALYRELKTPLKMDAAAGSYHDDNIHLSPTVDRLCSWDYRQSIRPWFKTLDPPPATIEDLQYMWQLQWPPINESPIEVSHDSPALKGPPRLSPQQNAGIDEERAHQAYNDAEYENNDPEYDPLFQLIPAGSRPLSDAEAANLLWPQYDSENSVISEDPPINYREEYPEYYEEFDRESYRRYRLRGGEKRFRSSDTGDEALYRELKTPLKMDAAAGSYHDDNIHLSPTVDRLCSWDYRQSIRPWFKTLDPPPATIEDLQYMWQLQWPPINESPIEVSHDSPALKGPPRLSPQQNAGIDMNLEGTRSVYNRASTCKDRSTQTPLVHTADKSTLACTASARDSPVVAQHDHTCPSGFKHCQCQRS